MYRCYILSRVSTNNKKLEKNLKIVTTSKGNKQNLHMRNPSCIENNAF